MAMESVSLSRDNSLEELRVVIEEKKGEVKRKFAELKKLLEISENTATNRLDRIYTDEREGVERSERTVTQLEQAKIVNSTLVDNTMNSLLQTTIRNFDDQIAKARNSACVVPKHISLRWSIEELKQSIENVCEVISSSTVKGQKPEATSQSMTSRQKANEIASYQTEIRTLQTELAHAKKQLLERDEISQREIQMLEDQKDKELEVVRKELEQRTKELVSLQEENLQMQEKYQNEISNCSLRLKELNKECSLLSINPPQKQIEEYEAITQDLKSQISQLQKQLESKETETDILRVNLENIRIHYSNLEKELQALKSANQTRTSDTILRLESKVEDLEMQLTLKYSECEDLQRKVVSLQSDLREARDVLAAKFESPREFGGLSRKDYSYKTSQSADLDYVRIPKKQMEEYETITQDLKSQIYQLQKQLESKETETDILKINLDDLREELENTRLQLQQTQQSNPTKVQSKRDSQTGTVVKEKQAHSKHKQQSKYATTKLLVNGKYSQFYTLNQVDNPSDLVGELVVCRAKRKSEYVIGTLKVVIPTKIRFEEAIVGIEFTNKFGDCSGSYLGVFYFKTIHKCALFIPTTEVFIYYNESPK